MKTNQLTRYALLLTMGMSMSLVVACADDGSSSSDSTGTATDGTTGAYPFAPIDDDSLASESTTAYNFETAGEFTATFDYKTVAGWPANADLSVAVAGEEAFFQVFTDKEKPLVRAGLSLQPLEVGASYDLKVTTDRMTLTKVGGDVVLDQAIELSDAKSLEVATPNPELFAAPVTVLKAN